MSSSFTGPVEVSSGSVSRARMSIFIKFPTIYVYYRKLRKSGKIVISSARRATVQRSLEVLQVPNTSPISVLWIQYNDGSGQTRRVRMPSVENHDF